MLHAASLLGQGVLLGVVVVTLLLIVLALAWRLAGTRVEFRQLSLVMAYIAAGLWLGACLGGFVFGLGIQFHDDRVFSRAVETLWPARGALPAGTGWTERLAAAERLMTATLDSGPVTIVLMVSTGIWFATGCWLLVAWQAFSASVGVSRWRALLTTTIWLALLGGAAALVSAAVTAQAQTSSTLEKPAMPTLRVELFEGRTVQQKRELARELTEACVRVLGGSAESVDVLFYDIARQDWATAGKLWSDQAPPPVST